MAMQVKREKLDPKADNIRKTGKMFPIQLSYHNKVVNMIRFNKDGTLFFSCSNDQSINIYSAIDYTRLQHIKCTEALKAFDVTSEAEYVVSGGFIGGVQVWEVEGGANVGKGKSENVELDLKINVVEFSYGDEYLLFAGEKMSDYTVSAIHVFRWSEFLAAIKAGKKVDESCSVYSKTFTKETFTRMKFGCLDNRIYYSTVNGYVKCISLDLEQDLMEIKVSQNEITSINFSKKFEFLVITTYEGCVILDPSTFEEIERIKTDYKMNCAQVSPLCTTKMGSKPHIIMGGGVQARDIAMAKEGGLDILLYNMISNKMLSQIRGHYGPVNWLEWYKDGCGFVSAGEEGIVRVFRFDASYFEDELYN